VEISLDCFPCFLRQTLEASRISGADEKMQKEVLNSVMAMLTDISEETTPPQIGWLVHETIRKATGNLDPYREIKRNHNEAVLKIETDLTDLINDSSAPLVNALKLAGTGNLIDMGPERSWTDVAEIFDGFMTKNSDYFDYQGFESFLRRSKTLLYLGDNAGEIVLDKILIKMLIQMTDLDITFAVRGGPIINDATMEDAEFTGITDMVRTIDTGAAFPGVVLEESSEEFLHSYHTADMILSKGQGNYESLSDERGNIFFLFKAKCPIVADKVGCGVGDLVLQKGRFLAEAFK
jgi:uncharacterized protein with ATP-grasp and redox domains